MNGTVLIRIMWMNRTVLIRIIKPDQLQLTPQTAILYENCESSHTFWRKESHNQNLLWWRSQRSYVRTDFVSQLGLTPVSLESLAVSAFGGVVTHTNFDSTFTLWVCRLWNIPKWAIETEPLTPTMQWESFSNNWQSKIYISLRYFGISLRKNQGSPIV